MITKAIEPITGFRKGGGTESRNCHLCHFMLGRVCSQPVMIRHSNQPRGRQGMPRVAKDDICKFFKTKVNNDNS